MSSEQFSLKWNNHTEHIVGVFESLLQSESLVDVTLACEGRSLRAHKLVLSACSPYFKTLFQEHSEAHPIVILRDVKFAELRSIVQFMYKGEVEVDQHDINSLISTAESLQIRGLAGPRAAMSSHFRPSSESLDPPMRPDRDSIDGGGASGDRKRPSSALEPATEAGEPPPPSLPPDNPASASSNGDDHAAVKRPKLEMESGEDNSIDGLDSGRAAAAGAASQLCQPQLLDAEAAAAAAAVQDPQLQAALNVAAAVNPALAAMNPATMTPIQRDAMQQQVQMFQDLMMPVINNITMGMTMAGSGVDIISNAAPSTKTGMSGLSCTVCAMIMPDLATLEQHLRIHEEEKPYKCIQCGQRYKYQSAYQRHIDMNHTARLPQEKPYKCEVCGQFFKYLKSFHKHRANHSAIDRILNTPADDSATTAAAEFSATRATMSANLMPQLPTQGRAPGHPHLSQETMEAMYRAAAAQAVQVHAGFGNKGLFVKEEELPNSITITPIKQERPDNQTLQDATQPPMQERPCASQPVTSGQSAGQPVSAAGQSDASQSDASQSEALLPPVASPEPAGDDPTAAELPGDDLTTADENFGGSKSGSWICPYCLKGFRGKENLKLHIRTHTGEKPYECGSCDKRFVGKSDLNRHLRIHTGEKPYECNICFRRFARGDYLSKHVVTHGQGGSPPPAAPLVSAADTNIPEGSTETVADEVTLSGDQPSFE